MRNIILVTSFCFLVTSCQTNGSGGIWDSIKDKLPTILWPNPDPKLPDVKPKPVQDSCVGEGKTYSTKTVRYPYGGSASRPNSSCRAPIIIGNNGTGAFPIYYRQEMQALARAGFFVVWPTNTNTGSGRTCKQAYDWARSQNSVYLPKAGVMGHSQGGSATTTCGYKLENSYRDVVFSYLPVQPAWGMGNVAIYSQMKKMRGDMLVFGGTRDTLVNDIWIQRGYSSYGAKKGWIVGVPATHFDQGRWVKDLAPLWFKASMFNSPEGKGGIDKLISSSYWRWKYRFSW